MKPDCVYAGAVQMSPLKSNLGLALGDALGPLWAQLVDWAPADGPATGQWLSRNAPAHRIKLPGLLPRIPPKWCPQVRTSSAHMRALNAHVRALSAHVRASLEDVSNTF